MNISFLSATHRYCKIQNIVDDIFIAKIEFKIRKSAKMNSRKFRKFLKSKQQKIRKQ